NPRPASSQRPDRRTGQAQRPGARSIPARRLRSDAARSGSPTSARRLPCASVLSRLALDPRPSPLASRCSPHARRRIERLRFVHRRVELRRTNVGVPKVAPRRLDAELATDAFGRVVAKPGRSPCIDAGALAGAFDRASVGVAGVDVTGRALALLPSCSTRDRARDLARLHSRLPPPALVAVTAPFARG